MYTSDLLHQKTTHDLLLTVLFSELGIYSVASPHTMYVGITLVFNDLRKALTSDLSETVRSNVLGTDVSRADDMALFYDLYTNINFFASCGVGMDVMLQQAVIPTVTKMLVTEPKVCQMVEVLCNDHAHNHGDLSRHRMKKALKLFNVNSYINLGSNSV